MKEKYKTVKYKQLIKLLDKCDVIYGRNQIANEIYELLIPKAKDDQRSDEVLPNDQLGSELGQEASHEK